MKKRIDWDQYFMVQAALLASRSTCTRLSVGAVLVRDKRIIGSGYNGAVAGDEHCIDVGCYLRDGHCVRGNECPFAVRQVWHLDGRGDGLRD